MFDRRLGLNLQQMFTGLFSDVEER